MPATSQKQQKFMNFVHAVQKGKASGKGYPGVEDAADEMKPRSVEHFMGRGHIDKSLPKKASAQKQVFGAIKRHQKSKSVNPNSFKNMNKAAFERGFLKAAIDKGMNPLTAVGILKSGFDANTSLEAFKSMVPQDANQLKGLINPALIGGGIGAVGGALTHPKHPVEGALGMGALGVLAGAGAGMYGQGAGQFGQEQKGLGASMSGMEHQLLPEAGKDPAVEKALLGLAGQHKGINQSSFLQSLMGHKNPVMDAEQGQANFQ